MTNKERYEEAVEEYIKIFVTSSENTMMVSDGSDCGEKDDDFALIQTADGSMYNFLDKYCPKQFEIMGVTQRTDDQYKLKRYNASEYRNANDINRRSVIITNGNPKAMFAASSSAAANKAVPDNKIV